MKPTAEQPVYVFRWGKHMPWKGRRCMVVACGKLNTALVRFTEVVTAVAAS